MRYQRVIIERLEQGLKPIDPVMAATLVQQFSAPAPDLATFCPQVVSFYRNQLENRGISTGDLVFPAAAENSEAIAFWIEDLEATALPQLRLAAAMKVA